MSRRRARGPWSTAATGKFFSNGLDLDWLSAHPGDGGQHLTAVHELLARVLALPVITVAALQGHTFAAGAMFSLAHDFRVMRADRGYWCLPEADINLPFTVGMSALIQARLTPQTAHQAMTTGRRYGGHDALAAAIVDQTADEHGVRQAAAEIAQTPGRQGGPRPSARSRPACTHLSSTRCVRRTTKARAYSTLVRSVA